MKIEGKAEDRILKICKKLNADKYISGTSWAPKHLDKEEFHSENIEIEYQNFVDPIYRQSHLPFMSKLSTIDLLFNEGEKAKDILKNSKYKIIKDEFLN